MTENITLTLEDFPRHILSIVIWKYTSPCLIIVGTLANILSVVVLFRKSMRTSTTMFYLKVLAFADILALYTGLLRYWLQCTFNIDLRKYSNFGCKLHVFLVYFSLDFSTWILVAVTVDRCIAVCLPFKSKTYCTVKYAKIAIASICVFLVALNCHLFGTVELDEKIGCHGISSFVLSVWPWIDICVYCIGPFTVMIVCNIIIIRQVILSNRQFGSHSELGNVESEIPIPSVCAGNLTMDNWFQNKSKGRLKKTSNVTVMLLTVNIVYFICTLPIAVYLIGYQFWVPGASLEEQATLNLAWAICNLFQYTNNTVNFFMYCLTGSKFRKELHRLFDFKNKT